MGTWTLRDLKTLEVYVKNTFANLRVSYMREVFSGYSLIADRSGYVFSIGYHHTPYPVTLATPTNTYQSG